MVNNPSTSGWDFFKKDPDQTAVKEVQEKSRDLNMAFSKVFETPAGKLVLAHFEKNTLGQMTFNPQVPLNPVYTAFFREGQNSIIREIKDRIEKGKRRE